MGQPRFTPRAEKLMPLSQDTLNHSYSVYQEHDRNTIRAAKALGISRSALQGRLKEYERRKKAVQVPRPFPCFPINSDEARRILALWAEHGNISSVAADACRIPETTFRVWVRAAHKLIGVSQGKVAPVDVPEKMKMTKTTVQYGPDGAVLQEWRRLAPEADMLATIADRLCAQVAGKAPKLPDAPKRVADGKMVQIGWWDAHFGKLAQKAETDTNYDVKTAKALVIGTTERICAEAGPCDKILLVFGGDTLHADTRHNRTELSGHALDVDTRQHKVWQYLTDAIHASVEIAARFAKNIEIVVIPGNHDWESSLHLRRLLAAYYRNDTRVYIDTTPKSRQYVQWGTVLIGIAHGNLMKMSDMATLMAYEEPQKWVSTTERCWFLGHIHKAKSLSYLSSDAVHGVTVEHMESISGTDAWHAENGFVGSPRRTVGIVWDKTNGMRQRIYVNVREIPVPE